MRFTGTLFFVFVLIVSMISTTFAASTTLIQEPINPYFIEYQQIRDMGMAVGEGEATGQIPDTIDFSYLRNVNGDVMIDSYVSYFDLRKQGKVTSVKDQDSCGACWTFASYGSLESTLMPGLNIDLSEQNMKNLHGFDIDSCSGGNAQMATAYLARWNGPVLESKDPYDISTTYSPSVSPVKHVQEIIFLPARQSSFDNDAIKWALQQYGAVDVSMEWVDFSYNSDTFSYYYAGSSTSDGHAVTIVGWDDNYDRNKFSPAAPGNGAFIVKNSWGDSWGENGYFYVSYYDSCIAKTTVNTVFIAEDATNYNNIYQYDPLGWCSSIGYGDTVAWGANVFTAKSTEDLNAVSFYTTDSQTSYEVFIYTDPVSGPIGNLKSTVDGSFTHPGYHTVDLDDKVHLTKGQKFSVVVKLTTTSYGYPLAIEKPISGYSSAATSNAGESYIGSNGLAWNDLKSYAANNNLCIKAFTSNALSSVDFTANVTSGVAPLSVQFTDLSDSFSSWKWNFGDATPVSSKQNPIHVYANEGNYTVSLNASSSAGYNTKTKFDYIVVADWNPWNDPDSHGGKSIILSELQEAIYDWRFGLTLTTGNIVDLTRLQELIYQWRFR